jgi:hypothetical protein
MKNNVNKHAVNGFVVKRDDGLYTGLCVAQNMQEAEQWKAKLGLVGEILTREEYDQTKEGKADQKILDDRKEKKKK